MRIFTYARVKFYPRMPLVPFGRRRVSMRVKREYNKFYRWPTPGAIVLLPTRWSYPRFTSACIWEQRGARASKMRVKLLFYLRMHSTAEVRYIDRNRV
jgi:hypothetical protein